MKAQRRYLDDTQHSWLRQWWQALQPREEGATAKLPGELLGLGRGDRARLKRCSGLDDLLLESATHRLAGRLMTLEAGKQWPRFNSADYAPLALLAGALAHVLEDSGDGASLAARLGDAKPGEPAFGLSVPYPLPGCRTPMRRGAARVPHHGPGLEGRLYQGRAGGVTMTAPVAMISGASRGIGAAIALALAGRGYRLSLGMRDPARLPENLAAHDPLVVAYDAEDPAAARSFVDATVARFGRIDALINNAGIAGPLELMPQTAQPDDEMEEVLDRLLSVNVKAPFRLTRAALPALCASGRGRVIVLASLSGKRVLGLNAGYQMTKHAAVSLSHAARRAGWDHGLRACAICPGFVATDLTLRHDLPRHEITQPEDLARIVAEIVTLPNSASVSELLVNWRYEPGM